VARFTGADRPEGDDSRPSISADRDSRARMDAGILLRMGCAPAGAGGNRRRGFARIPAAQHPNPVSSDSRNCPGAQVGAVRRPIDPRLACRARAGRAFVHRCTGHMPIHIRATRIDAQEAEGHMGREMLRASSGIEAEARRTRFSCPAPLLPARRAAAAAEEFGTAEKGGAGISGGQLCFIMKNKGLPGGAWLCRPLPRAAQSAREYRLSCAVLEREGALRWLASGGARERMPDAAFGVAEAMLQRQSRRPGESPGPGLRRIAVPAALAGLVPGDAFAPVRASMRMDLLAICG